MNHIRSSAFLILLICVQVVYGEDQSFRTFREHAHPVQSIAFTPDGKGISTGDEGGVLILRELSGRKRFSCPPPGKESGAVWCCSFSPDGKTLAAGYLWIGLTLSIEDQEDAEHGNVWARRKIMVDGQITREMGPCREVRQSSEAYNRCMMEDIPFGYNPFGTLSDIRTIDVATGKEIASLVRDGPSLTCLSFSSDGQSVLAAHFDGAVRAYRGTTNQRRFRPCEWKGYPNPLEKASFSPDGRTLAVLEYRSDTIKLWEVVTGKVYAKLPVPCDSPMSVTLSPNGRLVAVVGLNHSVSVIDALTHKVKEIQTPFTRRPGTNGLTEPVVFSPDSTRIAIGLPDNSLQITNLATGKSLAPLKGHTGFVRAIAFSPNGKLLATGGDDKTVKLWRLDDAPSEGR